eukprot:scaffold4370_cov317-Prasinococcus_capsulatus_cf.AAC.7
MPHPKIAGTGERGTEPSGWQMSAPCTQQLCESARAGMTACSRGVTAAMSVEEGVEEEDDDFGDFQSS